MSERAMNILYLGERSGTSRHRVSALRRMGFEVDVIDPKECFRNSSLAEIWIWRCGGFGMEQMVRHFVLSRLKHKTYDVCFVNHGELVGPSLLRDLRSRVKGILNYNLDNPFVRRDRNRWRIFWKAAPGYDLIATPRASNAEDGLRLGLPMYRFFQSADEVVHGEFLKHDLQGDRQGRLADSRFRSDVAFVGTWFPERGPFIARLLDAGINVRIFGPNWHKAAEFERLKPALAIGGQLNDDDYVTALRQTRIVLGFVSAGNQDLHTTRSMEIPAVGSLLCARRTVEHKLLYRENEEAVFWDDVEECAAHCRGLLAAPERLATIAAAGARRQAASEHWNEILLGKLIDATLSKVDQRRSQENAVGRTQAA